MCFGLAQMGELGLHVVWLLQLREYVNWSVSSEYNMVFSNEIFQGGGEGAYLQISLN